MEQRGNKVEQRGNKVEQRGNKVEQRGNKVEQRGNKVEGRGNKVEQRGNKVEHITRTMWVPNLDLIKDEIPRRSERKEGTRTHTNSKAWSSSRIKTL